MGGLVACGDDQKAAVDAPKAADAASPDAEVADTTWDEGGGVLAEYQLIFVPGVPPVADTTNVQARLTSFYWKSMNPKGYPFPINPGCNKTGMAELATLGTDGMEIFPFGLGKVTTVGGAADHTYLDVGTPIITGGAQQATIPLGVNPGNDGFGRHHDGVYHFAALANMGDTFLNKFDALYSLVLTGSDEWPAQVYPDAFYMSPPWTAISPSPTAKAQLLADTPLVETWSTPNQPTNRPNDNGTMNMVTAIIVAIGGVKVPVVECLDDNPFGHTQLTIPADMVNYARSFGPGGVIARAIITHRIQELTDGTTHNHKRMDFVTTWCYVVPYAAP